MPLRDHFRPPVSKRSSWEGFHGGWPMRIVEDLAPRLPDGFVAEPRVHLGSFYEIDVCAFEQKEDFEPSPLPGSRTAVWQLPRKPLRCQRSLSMPTSRNNMPTKSWFLILNAIAAWLRPSRSSARQTKTGPRADIACRQMLQFAATRRLRVNHRSGYHPPIQLIRRTARPSRPFRPGVQSAPPIYAVTCRKRQVGRQTKLDTWSHPLAVGHPLPSLPVWLSQTQTVSLDLDSSYEETCRVLRIP